MNISIPLRSLRHGQVLYKGSIQQSITFFSTSPCHTARTYYDLLGVDKNASAEEIKAAYFEKSKKLHPDMNPNKPELHKAFQEINEAYRILGNRSKRTAYDWHGRQSGAVYNAVRRSYDYYNSPSQYQTQPPPGFRHTMEYEDLSDYARSYQNQDKRAKHPQVVLGLILFMIVGAVIHVLFLSDRTKRYVQQRDETDRKLMDAYNKVREDAKNNGFQKQLDILVEKQKATTAYLKNKKD